jgi:hypothetical protein
MAGRSSACGLDDARCETNDLERPRMRSSWFSSELVPPRACVWLALSCASWTTCAHIREAHAYPPTASFPNAPEPASDESPGEGAPPGREPTPIGGASLAGAPWTSGSASGEGAATPLPPRHTIWSGVPGGGQLGAGSQPTGPWLERDTGKRERVGRGCALGDFCFGPVVTPGLPNLLGIGIHARQSDWLGFALDYQFLPAVTLESTSISAALWTAEARLFPLGGPIWLGGGFAFQTVEASTEVEYQGLSAPVTGTMGVPLLKLGLGFLGHSGLVIGVDVGVNLPLGSRDVALDVPSTSNGVAQAEIDRREAELQGSVDSVVGFLPVIPQVNLLRLGYLF